MKVIAEKLTNASGGRLDFFNIGGLLQQRTKETLWGIWAHYTWRELLIRGGIIIATAGFSMLAVNRFTDPDSTLLTKVLVGTAGGAAGFFSSHAVAVAPTMMNRHSIIVATRTIRDQTLQHLRNSAPLVENDHSASLHLTKLIMIVDKATNDIINLKMPVTKRSEGVINLVRKKSWIRLIDEKVDELITSLKNDAANQAELLTKASQFLAQDTKTIITTLELEKQSAPPVINKM